MEAAAPDSADSEVSRHKCLIYDGQPSEQLPVVVPLLLQGLSENWRCLYLGDPETVEIVRAALAARGTDVAGETARGALVFSSDRSHLEGGGFDPRAMVGMLRGLIDQAVKDGFQGLCATGDMMWELGSVKNFSRLLEYEALLEQVFREKPLMGICQYRRDTVPARAIEDALLTHRSACIGGALERDNLFYLPPELLLEGSGEAGREKRGAWMCRQIVRILKAERKRDQALQSLAETNESLERRVQERTEELEAFSYSVSHDLRAPLRHINGFAMIVEKESGGRLSDEGKRCLSKISASITKMGVLIDDLLTFSRASRAELRKRPVPLGELVADVLRDLEPETASRRIDWRVGALPEAACDPALLRLVFVNLLGNAVKFTRPRSQAVIELGAERKDGSVVVFVRDNGVGFDPSSAEKLFVAFQRLHSQKEFEGTGVGLANVERIVRRHGGRAWAQGDKGVGATFYFSLPDEDS